MKMKKFLASVLAVLMTVSSMSFIASAQEEGGDQTTPTTVTITFNRRNGANHKDGKVVISDAISTAEFTVGAAIEFPVNPTFIYHTFKGWSTEIDGEVIEDLSAVTATEPTTYYGVWEWSKPDDGTPLDSITRAKNESIANQTCSDGGTWYDAVAGVVYKTFKPQTVGSTGSANMYNSLKYSIPGTSLYMVALVRTNMTGATGNVTAGIYNTSNKDGDPKSQLISGSPVKTPDEWTVMILGNNNIQNFGIGTHVDFDVTGNDPADDLENDYYDVAGMALFATEEDARAWDIYAQNAYQGTAVISFDAQLTADDDTDVYTEYPENLKNDGNALVGWTLDPTAETIEYVDLTKISVPTANVTYYAVWNEERTINFYKNDGTDAVETLVLGKGSHVTVPTFAIEGKKFLGWALEDAEEAYDFTDAEGNSTRYRAADGVFGNAELYGEESVLEIALEAGNYAVSYTDEGVSVKGEFVDPSMTQFFKLNADNNYTVEASEDVIRCAAENAPKGYKFSGEFATRDGKYETVNGTLTVTEYTDTYINLYPVYVEDDSVAFYHTTAVYNDKFGTLDVTVAIANGKFTAGTVGGTFDKTALEFAGYTLSDAVSNNLGDAPTIVRDAMYDGEDNKFVLVWDAMNGNIDATAEDVEIITFHFDIADGVAINAENIYDYVGFYHPENAYEGYFADGFYKVSPVLAEGEDEFTVNYVNVYESAIEFKLAPTDPATITVTVHMPKKAGATTDDIAYLAYANATDGSWNFIAIEEVGNENTTITATISDVFYVGETYYFTIIKNGYTGSNEIVHTLTANQNFETTIICGDIKDSFTGEDENAVDIYDFGDGEITLADFVRVVRAFDEAATDEYKAVVDVNEDGVVNVTDLSIIKENFGASYIDVALEVTENV